MQGLGMLCIRSRLEVMMLRAFVVCVVVQRKQSVCVSLQSVVDIGAGGGWGVGGLVCVLAMVVCVVPVFLFGGCPLLRSLSYFLVFCVISAVKATCSLAPAVTCTLDTMSYYAVADGADDCNWLLSRSIQMHVNMDMDQKRRFNMGGYIVTYNYCFGGSSLL